MRIAVNASIVDEAPTGLGLYAINVVRELITILDVSDEVTVFTGYSPAFSDLGVRIVNTGRLARPSFGANRCSPHSHSPRATTSHTT